MTLRPVLPGATIGVLGSGQLGRMFTLAAREMGYRVHTYSPEDDTPTGQVADREIQAAYDDLERVRAFAAEVDVVTFEFENVPATTIAAIDALVPVHPRGEVLAITQHRLREKTWLRDHGFPVADFHPIHSADELAAALPDLGNAGILKTAGWGYDGKGQVRLEPAQDPATIWAELGTDEAILEAIVPFDAEASVIAARGQDGEVVDYGLFENQHVRHILDCTLAPGRFTPQLAEEATLLARGILEALDVVGVMCIELFVVGDQLVVNELAPRPHNSGHLTLDASHTSQFGQQVRAICGLPLGSSAQFSPAAMANVLGEWWNSGTPNWGAALSDPAVQLHLYGKAEPRRGRKMGHLTALGSTSANARERVLAARERLDSA